MNIRRVLLIVFVLTLADISVSAQTSFTTKSAQDCSQLVVNHSYSQTFQGFLNIPAYFASFGVPSPPGMGLVPNGGTGYLTFLPHGKLSGRVTLAIGLLGLIPDLQPDETSQYTLTWDTSNKPPLCSGTLTMNVPGEDSFHFQLVASEDGQQIEMIHTDPGLIVSVTGTRVRTAGCSNNSVQGKFAANARGWLLSPDSGPMHFPPEQLLSGYAPFAFSGGLQFQARMSPSPVDFPEAPEGAASTSGWDTISLNGLILSRTERGWYKINPDCTGTMTLRDDLGNPDFHLELFVGERGDSVHMVNVDAIPDTGVPLFVLGMTVTRDAGPR